MPGFVDPCSIYPDFLFVSRVSDSGLWVEELHQVPCLEVIGELDPQLPLA